jgi:hypothetical protein
MTPRLTYPRVLGLLTAAYGAYTLARPESLPRTVGLDRGERDGAATGRALGRLVGARDLVSGASMVLLPPGPALRTAIAARVACDASDAVAFGSTAPSDRRALVLGVTTGWALLCASSWPFGGSR